MSQGPLDQLTLAKFKELLNTRFRVQSAPANAVELELIEAGSATNDAEGGSRAPSHENFSLIFSGPAEQPLT